MAELKIEQLMSSVLEELERSLAELPQQAPANAARQLAGAIDTSVRAVEQLAREPVNDALLNHFDATSDQLASLAALFATRCGGDAAISKGLSELVTSFDGQRDQIITTIASMAPVSHIDEPAEARPSFLASRDFPALHQLESDAWRQLVGKAVRPPETSGDAAVLWRRAESLLSRMTILLRAREPAPWQPWVASSTVFDEPLLACFDGLVAIGHEGCIDIIEVLASWLHRAPDPSRTALRAWIFGCLDGDQAARAGVIAWRRSRAATLPAQSSALVLASSPSTQHSLELLCGDAPHIIMHAVHTLVGRHAARLPVLVPLLAHCDRRVRRGAVEAVGHCEERIAARDVLLPLAYEEDDDSVVAAIIEALLRLDEPTALTILRNTLSEEAQLPGTLSARARHAMLRSLALAGTSADLELLLTLAQSPAEVALIGWFGHPASLRPLLSILEEQEQAPSSIGSENRPMAAARALRRITSAASSNAPIDIRRRVDFVPPDPATFEPWLEKNPPGEARLRHGQPHSIEAIIDELQPPGTPADTRQLLALELALLTGGKASLTTNDWVSRQHQQLLATRSFIEARGDALHRPGEWSGERLGKRG